MKTLIDRLGRLLDGVTALLLALMVLLVFGNVVLRYAMNDGITESEELSRWMFVWMTFIGAVVALKDHGHLGTDMLISKLSRTGRRVCLAISQVLMLGVTWLVFSGSLAQARINLDVEAPVTGLSVSIFYGAGVVFAVLSGLLLLRELARNLGGRSSDAELVMVQESEDLAALHDNDATRR